MVTISIGIGYWNAFENDLCQSADGCYISLHYRMWMDLYTGSWRTLCKIDISPKMR
jgi:hypothetical protein